MNRILTSFAALALLVLAAPSAQASPPKASISAVLGGAALSASASGVPFQGAGTYGPYPLMVTGGIVQGTYVTFTGVIVAGTAKVAFKLDADSKTGAVRLAYMGASPVTLNGKGAVLLAK